MFYFNVVYFNKRLNECFQIINAKLTGCITKCLFWVWMGLNEYPIHTSGNSRSG